MIQKVRTSARRRASRPADDKMVIVAVKDLSPDAKPVMVAHYSNWTDAQLQLLREQMRAAGATVHVPTKSSSLKEIANAFAPPAAAGPESVAEARLINASAFEPDARSLAILEGVRVAQQDLEDAGGAYDLEQVRTLLRGVSRQAIDKRVQEGSLLAVPDPSNHRGYPTFQFNGDGSIVAGLKEVREALPVKSSWAVLNFLVNPDDRLAGRKPIEVLRAADIARVVEAARLFGQPSG